MMRQSLDADSPYAFVMATPGNGIDFQWRTAEGADSNWVGNIGVNAEAPYRVKLTRTGSTFTAGTSPDGKTWTSLGSIVIPMSTQVYVGLAVCAHNDRLVNESTFDNVQVSEAVSKDYIAIQARGGPMGTYLADTDFNDDHRRAAKTQPVQSDSRERVF